MASYNIIVDDLKVRIEHIASGQKQSFPRSGYRVELRSNGVNIVEQGSGVKVFTIREAKDLGSITDNRTTAGATTPISTLSEIYDILDATATPFFFLNLAALAADVLHDPFLLQDGTINPGSLDGTGVVRVATAYPNSIGFNSITPDQNNSVFAQELRFNSSLNTEVMTAIGSGFKVEAGDVYGLGATWDNLIISTDGTAGTSDFSENYIYMENSTSASTPGNYFAHGYERSIGTSFNAINAGGTNRVASIGVAGYRTFYSANHNLTAFADTIAYNSAVSSARATLNGATYQRSVALGGDQIVINKSDYAFAQNLEVQGGTLRGATNLIMQADTSGYVDIQPNNKSDYSNGWAYMASDQFSAGFTNNHQFVAKSTEITMSHGGVKRFWANSTGVAFNGTTPIAKPTTAGAAAAFVANTSGIADDTATFDGYTIGQVVKALRNYGLLT